MQSPTHTLIALAILSRKGTRKRNLAVFWGAVIPDAFIYGAWIWLTFVKGESQSRIWNEIYFDAPLQALASAFNSVPLFIILALSGWVLMRRSVSLLKAATMLYYFALAALIHIAFDFPVHNHDAYAYFEPFTDWRFYSPLSYYERSYHGVCVATFEAILAGTCIFVLWRRFAARWVKVVLGVFALIYTAQMAVLHLAPLLSQG